MKLPVSLINLGMALIALQPISSSAALYSGTTDLDLFIRDSFSQTSIFGTDPATSSLTTYTLDFNNPTVGPGTIDLELEVFGGAVISNTVQSFIDSATLQTANYTITTSITRLTSQLNLGPGTLMTSHPLSFIFPFPIADVPVTSASVSIEGNYTIVGPNGTITNNFIHTDPDLIGSGNLGAGGIISANPNDVSLGFGFGTFPASFSTGPFDPLVFLDVANNNPVIFEEVIDGNTITNRFDVVSLSPGFATLTPVPEISSFTLSLLASFFFFRRRR